MESLPGIEPLVIAYHGRVYRLLDSYCNGLIVIPTMGTDWAYINLRDALIRLCEGSKVYTDQSLESLTQDLKDALPESLHHLDGAVAGDAWEFQIQPALSSFLGSFLAACQRANIQPFCEVADQTVGEHFGYDSFIETYEKAKQAAERASRRAINTGLGLRGCEEAADKAFKALFVPPDNAKDSPTTEQPSSPKPKHQRRAAERKERALLLRKQGLSVKEIAHALNVQERRVYDYLS